MTTDMHFLSVRAPPTRSNSQRFLKMEGCSYFKVATAILWEVRNLANPKFKCCSSGQQSSFSQGVTFFNF